MPPVSSQAFKKALQGSKTFFSQTLSKKIRAAGFGRLLSQKAISQNQALRAFEQLRGAEELPYGRKRPAQLWQAAIKEQTKKDQAEQAIRQKHIQTRIKMDIAEELAEEALGGDQTQYDPRSVLGKRVVIDIERKQNQREKEITAEQEKRAKLYHSKKSLEQRPKLVDLPDLDIG